MLCWWHIGLSCSFAWWHIRSGGMLYRWYIGVSGIFAWWHIRSGGGLWRVRSSRFGVGVISASRLATLALGAVSRVITILHSVVAPSSERARAFGVVIFNIVESKSKVVDAVSILLQAPVGSHSYEVHFGVQNCRRRKFFFGN